MQMTKKTGFNIINSLMRFLDAGVCNFLVVDTVAKLLKNNGFEQLEPSQTWNLKTVLQYLLLWLARVKLPTGLK